MGLGYRMPLKILMDSGSQSWSDHPPVVTLLWMKTGHPILKKYQKNTTYHQQITTNIQKKQQITPTERSPYRPGAHPLQHSLFDKPKLSVFNQGAAVIRLRTEKDVCSSMLSL